MRLYEYNKLHKRKLGEKEKLSSKDKEDLRKFVNKNFVILKEVFVSGFDYDSLRKEI